MKLISLEKDPNIKIPKDINYYLNPDYIFLPGENIHVKQDEIVYKNMCAAGNYKSSVSGIAYGMKKCLITNSWQDCLVIKNDFREVEKKEKRTKKKVTIKNILSSLEREDQVLLEKFKSQTKFDNIIITALNDEPYVYNNIFILKENISELLELLDELSLIYKSDKNYLIVKNVDTLIINECLNVIGTYPNINLTLVNDEYLLERKEFIEDKLQVNGNTLYLTTTELLSLNNYLQDKDNTTLLLTLTNNIIGESKIIRVKKYTLLSDILDNYFKINTDNYQVIANGLMQGYEITNLTNFIITNDIFAINIINLPSQAEPKCINCGRCIDICPSGVNLLSGKNIAKCLDCGLCSYICPGFVNLKEKLKEYKK